MLADPKRFLRRATIFVRTRGEPSWRAADIELRSTASSGRDARLVLPAIEATKPVSLELYLRAYDDKGNEVLTWADPARPREIPLRYDPPIPWYRRTWFYAAVGSAVAASVGITVYELTLAPPDRLETKEALLAAEGDGDGEKPDGKKAAKAGGDAPATARRKARVSAGQRILRPSEHELTVQIVVRNSLIRAVERHPDVAEALKQDIARALVFAADSAFLHGDGNQSTPEGITAFAQGLRIDSTDPLEVARAILWHLRVNAPKRFESPGWILDPATLDALTRLEVPGTDTRTLDDTRLLELDGLDGGMLLGYPFVVSRAATEGDVSRIYFSSDWTEAWIGAGSDLVTVDMSSEADFAEDSTIVKAVMNHDFVVRRPGLFTFTEAPRPG